MSNAVVLKNITKKFGDSYANDCCNLEVRKGEIHSLLGENGAGKSTLMNILFGLYQPDDGEIYINEQLVTVKDSGEAFKLGLGMVHQHFMLIENMTVLQNIILGQEMGGFAIDYKKCRESVSAVLKEYDFDLDLDAMVGDLSVGMMQRVEIVKTLYRGAEIIVLDEPTAVLSPNESDNLLRILMNMRAKGKTIIFITHKLNETMSIADRATILRGGKNAGHVDITGIDTNDLVSMMVGRQIDLNIKKPYQKPGRQLLEIDGVRLLKNAKRPIHLDACEGEIIGIAGVDGNGQLELENAIMGLGKSTEGKIILDGVDITQKTTKEIKKLGVGYIPSDRYSRAILPSLSLKENIVLGLQEDKEYSSNGFINKKKQREKCKELIKQFDVKCSNLDQKIGTLSGGNQQKLVFSREINRRYKIILVSQPCRGLDIGASQFIRQELLRLRSENKTVILISADLDEIQQISDRIAVLYKGDVIAFKPASEYEPGELGSLLGGKGKVE